MRRYAGRSNWILLVGAEGAVEVEEDELLEPPFLKTRKPAMAAMMAMPPIISGSLDLLPVGVGDG